MAEKQKLNCGECLFHHVEVVTLNADGTCSCCARGHVQIIRSIDIATAKRRLVAGTHSVIATVPVSEQRIRIIRIRRHAGNWEGKYINDGKWYLIYKVEIQ